MSNQEQNPVVVNPYVFAEAYKDAGPENTIILHKDFKLESLQGYQDHARRLKAQFDTIDAQSYFDYVLSRKAESSKFKSRTFINANNPEQQLIALTVLNFGTSESATSAGHRDDIAVLNLSKEPMLADFLSEVAKTWFKPNKFAEALEAYNGTLEMYGQTGEDVVTTGTIINTFRNLKIEATQTSETKSNSAYDSEQSDIEKFEAQATGGVVLPEYFYIKNPIYTGLEDQTVTFKVIMRQGKNEETGKPYAEFQLKPIALKYAYLKAAVSFQNLVREQLEGEDTYLGTIR